jgi:putative transposase
MIYFWRYRKELNVSLSEFYRSISITKQGMHQMLNRSMKYNEEVIYIKDLLEQIREDHPTMSCRAMYYKINPSIMGRDKFEALCRDLGFYVEKKKKYCRTTDSFGVIRFDNLLKDTTITSINQVWSSDITFYEVGEVFYFLTFIVDHYCRTIVGYNVSGRLTTEQTSLPALKMAIKKRGKQIEGKRVIFHSDGGGQYYDKNFLRLTEQYKFRNSMCEFAYENGKSERINGVIKNNYLKYRNIKTLEDLIKEVDRAVNLYNTEKPHKSLNYKTPFMIEKEQLYLQWQTTSKMKESFDENTQDLGASSPLNPGQTTSQNQDVFNEKLTVNLVSS